MVLRIRYRSVIYIRNVSSWKWSGEGEVRERLTRIAGSLGTFGGEGCFDSLSASTILISLTSLPLKTMYSNFCCEAGMKLSTFRPSVP